MSALSISSDLLCSFQATDDFLTDSQFKTSQLLRKFCSEAVSWAPLCGMMLGRIAAPLVQFRSAQLFNSLGLGNTLSHGTSWVLATTTEGAAMAVVPGILMGEGLQPQTWRGISHGTVMMMVCQGISKRVPLPGVLGMLGQDAGVMSVDWAFGEIGVTEKVHGSLMARWMEARVVSCRMQVSGALVRMSCVQTAYLEARNELNYRLSKGPKGMEETSFFSPQEVLATNNGMKVRFEGGSTKQGELTGLLTLFRRGDSPPKGRRGWRETNVKTAPREASYGERKRDKKIVEKALTSMNAAVAALDQTSQELKSGKSTAKFNDPWEVLEWYSRKDPDLVKAVLAIAAAFEFPGMYNHREPLQDILRDPKLTSKEKYDAVVRKVDEILIKDHALRKRWQALQPTVSFKDKILYTIPNLVSLAGIGCGAYSMTLSAEGRFGEAIKYLVGAAILDGLDGKIARLLKKSSEFGGKLDTGCDTVNYPVGGGFFAYEVLNYLGHPELGLVAGGLILFNGVLRLTIFEILRQFKILIPPQDVVGKKYTDPSSFWGTASTIEAIILPAAYILFKDNPEAFYAIAAGSGATMVMPVILSKIGGGTLKWIKKHPFPSAILGSAALSVVGTSVVREDPKYIAAATLIVWGSYVASGFIPQSKASHASVQSPPPQEVSKSSEGTPRQGRRVRNRKGRRGH